jgi:hypothetical protein
MCMYDKCMQAYMYMYVNTHTSSHVCKYMCIHNTSMNIYSTYTKKQLHRHKKNKYSTDTQKKQYLDTLDVGHEDTIVCGCVCVCDLLSHISSWTFWT